MKVKDLKNDTNLRGLHIRIPDDIDSDLREGFIINYWPSGIWITKTEKEAFLGGRIYPVFIEDVKDVLNWEIIQ